jgi:hypothetical protein
MVPTKQPPQRRHRIVVLGAGFSKHAGLPLGVELWQEILDRAKVLQGRAGKFQDDLTTYRTFREQCDGVHLPLEQIDFEEFLGFLDIEFFLGLRGSDTWSDDGNETQILVKTLIGEILTERTPDPGQIPDLYIEFARSLQPDDLVITFNYDVLLERALDSVGKRYRLFPNRYKSVDPQQAEVDSTCDEVIILKMHGSVDWFDRRRYLDRIDAFKRVGLPGPKDDPIFGRDDLVVEPLVDGPRFPHDALKEMHRVRNVERFYRRQPFFRATPWLLTPSTMKIVHALRDFWRGLGRSGGLNLGFAIIGFSLPKHDEYARQVMYRLVQNYQGVYWGEKIIGLYKTPVVLVDHRLPGASREDFKRRYGFVEWDKAVCCFEGFNVDALASVFSEQAQE